MMTPHNSCCGLYQRRQ